MIKIIAIILLALSTAGAGYFGWTQKSSSAAAMAQVAELTEKVEEADKKIEAAEAKLKALSEAEALAKQRTGTAPSSSAASPPSSTATPAATAPADAAKKSLEIFHYNIFGHDYNPCIKLTATQSQAKQIRDFFAKNAIIKAFFKGFDRKDEKENTPVPPTPDAPEKK
jgi:hypothetical protein